MAFRGTGCDTQSTGTNRGQTRFQKSISEIDRMFTADYKTWGVVNLKEWIDSYESSRFTQIDTHTAIITSEYNMDCLKESLLKNTPIITHELLYV